MGRKPLQQCKMRPSTSDCSHEDVAAALDPAIPILGNQAAHRDLGPQIWGHVIFLVPWAQQQGNSLWFVQTPNVIH